MRSSAFPPANPLRVRGWNSGPRVQGRGFTLIEILVGIALLVLIAVLIVQLVSATGMATRMSNRGIDAAAQARLALDRIGLDLVARVKRSDADFVATNSIGAGPPYPLLFLSELTSPTPQGVSSTNNRGISLVGYQISTNADSPRRCLLRAGKALVWTNTGVIGTSNGLPASLAGASYPIQLSATDFDVLAYAVIRVVIGFQLYPDNGPTPVAGGASVANSQGQIVYTPPVLLDASGNPTSQIDLSRVSSLIVGVVSMDPEVMEQLTDDQVRDLAGKFPLPADGQLPVAAWASIADNAQGLPANVPLPARQSLRVFQRAFPINPYGVMQ